MQDMLVSLRPAAANDWPAVAALLEANKLPLDGAREHLSNYLLATDDDEIVGCAGAEVYGSVALLRSVAVAPRLRGRRVGRALVTRMLEEAARRQIGSIHLLTVTAPEYFSQFGFKRGPIEHAPLALKASAEMSGACPACSAFMSLRLNQAASTRTELPVAVLGAGPVGLAAAARLAERGVPFLLLEAGDEVGANLLDYGHVQLFSPWRYNIDAAMAKMLEATGWRAPPPEELPRAGEIVARVLKPFAALPQIASAMHLRTRVESVSREGYDKVKSDGREKAPFVVRAMRDGNTVEYRVRAVIDATGTWSTPNPLGANGLAARGERELADVIAYGIPDVLGRDRAKYAGKRTLVVGAGHSAANALLALAELARDVAGTRLIWAVRSPTLARVFGGGDADALPARGKLGQSLKALRDDGALTFLSGMRITDVAREGSRITVRGIDAAGQPVTQTDIDAIICATGQRPDLSLTRELRLKLDPWIESTEALGPLIDPNVHSCGTVRPHGHRELAHPEPGFYTLGVKSYGRAPTFLMATGFEQARSVVAAIAGDSAAADRVELDLPETGVCSVDLAQAAGEGATASACCGSQSTPASPAATAAPVAVEAPAKAPGCGTSSCGTPPVARQKVACCG
jgi:N-acetylglutamate synthase-like GNAT family acetyltransferase/thioredoxin reductase